MTIHLLAIVLVGAMAVGDSGDSSGKTPALKLPQTATTGETLLERAARDYRIQTYETFHNDRAEYDRRSAEGARVEAAWTEAGRNDAEQPMLIRWFDQATAASRTDSIADLPAEPKFTAMPQKKETEKKLVETTPSDSVEDAAATVDNLLHVKPAGSATPVVDSTAKPTPESASVPVVPPADGTFPSAPANKPTPTNPATTVAPAAPQSKPSTIGSLPTAFGAEISHSLQGLSGKLAPAAPSQGH